MQNYNFRLIYVDFWILYDILKYITKNRNNVMPRGGSRIGAGRPRGQGKYKEPTKPIRVPESLISGVMEFVESSGYNLPLYSCSVQAGFPSPADDHMEGELDLNKYLIKHPTATFFVRAAGESMIGAGIHPGDIWVVDRSEEAKHGKIVIAAIDGQLTVKRLHKSKSETYLLPENKDFEAIKFDEGNEVVIWGVVTSVLHRV